MAYKRHKINQNLIYFVALLFTIELILLPFVFSITFANSHITPDVTATYKDDKVIWTGPKVVDMNNNVSLDLFEREEGEDEPLIEPGDSGNYNLRVRNSSRYGSVDYMLLVYNKNELDADLNVNAVVTDGAQQSVGIEDISKEKQNWLQSSLVENGLTNKNVLAVYDSSLTKNQNDDLKMNWEWAYYISDEMDKIDTSVGNAAVPEDIDFTVGMIVLFDPDSSTYDPDPGPSPKPDPGHGGGVVTPGEDEKPIIPPTPDEDVDKPIVTPKPEDKDKPIITPIPWNEGRPIDTPTPWDKDGLGLTTELTSEGTPIESAGETDKAGTIKKPVTILEILTPKTDDNGLIYTWCILIVVTVIVLIFLIFCKRKKDDGDDDIEDNQADSVEEDKNS